MRNKFMNTGDVSQVRPLQVPQNIRQASGTRTPPPKPPRTEIESQNIKILNTFLENLKIVENGGTLLLVNPTTISLGENKKSRFFSLFGKGRQLNKQSIAAYEKILRTTQGILIETKNPAEIDKAKDVMLALADKEKNVYVKNIIQHKPKLRREVENFVAHEKLSDLVKSISITKIAHTKVGLDDLLKDKDFLKTMKKDRRLGEEVKIIKNILNFSKYADIEMLINFYSQPTRADELVFVKNKFQIKSKNQNIKTGRKDITDPKAVKNKVSNHLTNLTNQLENLQNLQTHKELHPRSSEELVKLREQIDLIRHLQAKLNLDRS